MFNDPCHNERNCIFVNSGIQNADFFDCILRNRKRRCQELQKTHLENLRQFLVGICVYVNELEIVFKDNDDNITAIIEVGGILSDASPTKLCLTQDWHTDFKASGKQQ